MISKPDIKKLITFRLKDADVLFKSNAMQLQFILVVLLLNWL
jgi:hypothetical protein